MRTNKNLIQLLILGGLTLGFVGCSGSEENKDTQAAASSSNEKNTIEPTSREVESFNQAKAIMYSLPSPVETMLLLKKANAKYDISLLAPVENSNKYNTDKQKSLAMGVYAADMSYASINDDNATVLNYMNESKNIAKDLGLLEAIDPSIISRLENQFKQNTKDTRDSVIRIVTETFMNTNAQLKADDDRPYMAAMILAGGAIEALYLATQMAFDVNEDKELIERIVEQKESFNVMKKMLLEYNDREDVASIVAQIEPIMQAYDVIKIEKSEIQTIVNEKTNEVVLQSTQKINITQDQYDALKDAAKSLRKSIVQ